MHPHQLTDPAQIRAFVFAGNARLTLVSRKTGTRFTYQVRAAKDGGGPVSHFVGLLNGPDNEGDYAYLGHYYEGGDALRGRYTHGRKSSISPGRAPSAAWRWFDAYVIGLGEVPADLEVWHEGRCGRCGRALTVPESIARGIGPECAGKMS